MALALDSVHPSKVSLRLGLRAYRDVLAFSGRSTRTEVFSLWLVQTGFAFCVVMLHFAAAPFLRSLYVPEVLDIASQLVFLVPWFALLTRRINDHNRSGKTGAIVMAAVVALAWYFDTDRNPALRDSWTGMIFAILANIAFLAALFLPGTSGPNRYGPDPRDI